jgi:hypothetical protein
LRLANEERKAYRNAVREIADYRRDGLLPCDSILERVMRAETHFSRVLHRDLHELQRLQVLRLGQSVALPIAIEVPKATD